MPSLNLLPATTWMVVFGTGAAWFGACAARSPSQARFSWHCRYPVPHLIECIAMLYMLLAVRGARQGIGMAMPGMGTSPGTSAAFPALAVVLALFMLGYVMWATDQLASLARAKITTTIPARIPEQRALAAVSSAAVPPAPPEQLTHQISPRRQQRSASRTLLTPKLAVFGKIAMGITMGYMLILMV